MSLINKNQLSLVLQTIKKLLSFKADKSEVVLKDAFTAEKALDLVIKMEVIEPLAAKDGTIYTTPDGIIYTL